MCQEQETQYFFFFRDRSAVKQYGNLVVRVEVDDAAVRKGRNGYLNSSIIEYTAETKICEKNFHSIPTRK